jgi:molybdate transport system substrate-binding protein
MLNKSLRSTCLAICFYAVASPSFAGDITLSAASSLTDAFKEIALSFEQKHPGTKVYLNVAASGALLQQMSKGAPVDVAAFADIETMDQAQSLGLVKESDRTLFASNTLVMIVPKESRLDIKELKDLTRPEFKRIALGNPASVPAGRYAKKAFDAHATWETISPKFIYTQNVRQALDYAVRGEVDASIVFSTDARLKLDKLRVIQDLAELKNIAIHYPIAVAKHSKNPAESQAFVEFVMSVQGQSILNKFGFTKTAKD